MKSKVCRKCGKRKLVKKFGKNIRMMDGLQKWCRQCCSKYKKEGYRNRSLEVKQHAEEYKKEYCQRPEVRQYRKEYYLNFKHKALSRIGKLICVLCRCTNITELTIDHINGMGAAHRLKLFGNKYAAGTPFYLWVLKAPKKELKDAYLRILCRSCNNGTKNNSDKEWLMKLRKIK
ncbi:MAG: hypothetical protein QQN41_06140 [Nitrosopumilus sp.]